MYTVLDKIYAGQDSSGGTSKTMYRVTIQCDTAADMPDPEEHWAAGSTCEVLEGGGSKYRMSNAGTWVEANFETGGGGNGDDVPEFETVADGVRIALGRSIPTAQNPAIVGHDAFYSANGFGLLTKIPFDVSEQTTLQMVNIEGGQCFIDLLAYGNGVYFGVSKQRGVIYKSADCVNWEMLYDVQITPNEITSISFANGDFYFGLSSGNIGAALNSESYSRVTDYSTMYQDVVMTGVLQDVFGHFGNQFFVTDSGIVSGNLGGGEIRRLAFLEEAPDDPYAATSTAFWNNNLVIFDDGNQLIYTMPMRFPHDTGGNFIDPEWHFYRDNDWRNEMYPVGVCNVGENLLVFTDRHIFNIDKNGDITQLTTLDLSLGGANRILTADKTILVCRDTQAFQFFIK